MVEDDLFRDAWAPRHLRRACALAVPLVILLACASLLSSTPLRPQQVESLRAVSSREGNLYRLGNAAIEATFSVLDGRLSGLQIRDPRSQRELDLDSEFSYALIEEESRSAAMLHLAGPVTVLPLAANLSATRLAERSAGIQICAEFDQDRRLDVRWCLILRDGSRYLRQTFTLRARESAVPVDTVTLLNFLDPGARVAGSVAGSPMVDDRAFFAVEDPMANSIVTNGRVVGRRQRALPIQAQQEVTYSSVIGFAEDTQIRRAFLAYLERERIHPYRPFLTYNSWYDLGFGERYGEADALDRVHSFGEELTRKRGITMDSFLFDDGWDDTASFWQFNPGFPHGMAKVSKQASSIGAGVGMWLSPWGGYDQAKKARIAYGRAHGYEIVHDGYALSGPRYFHDFQNVCLELIKQFGVNQFKFDGTGNANQVVKGSAFDSDFDAAIHLMSTLRKQRPDLFINLTTGTYPSPFWLDYADSIWRGGEDNDFAGTGNWRQKWITYRDAQTFKNIVERGPLFPLNSLMLHSIIYAREAEHLGLVSGDPRGTDQDFADEVWTFFGSGTDLQELYITPSLLDAANWDQLASAARWSRTNSSTLLDTHWIGGDPAALSVYGWASWSPAKAVLVLRNPSDRPQAITIDARTAFELPTGIPQPHSHFTDPRETTKHKASVALVPGKPSRISLAPFQVLVLESSAE